MIRVWITQQDKIKHYLIDKGIVVVNGDMVFHVKGEKKVFPLTTLELIEEIKNDGE